LAVFRSSNILANSNFPLNAALDEFMNLNLWKQNGSISIWRYKPLNKNFPGWHMSADKEGYESLLQFLNLLELSPVGSKRTLKLIKPDIWSASTTLKKTPEKKVLIALSSSIDDWHLKTEQDRLLFSIGVQQIHVLKAGIMDAKNGEYDFSVGAKDGQTCGFGNIHLTSHSSRTNNSWFCSLRSLL
jgi:hypothetical protein